MQLGAQWQVQESSCGWRESTCQIIQANWWCQALWNSEFLQGFVGRRWYFKQSHRERTKGWAYWEKSTFEKFVRRLKYDRSTAAEGNVTTFWYRNIDSLLYILINIYFHCLVSSNYSFHSYTKNLHIWKF